MDTAVRFFFAAIAIFAMVNHADAETARDDAEVVLESGEINSSTVKVDDFVVVVYGQGEQQPTSGKWAKLDTIKGYVKAVKQRALLLSLERYGWPESIALERIQTLTIVAPSASVRTNDMGVGKRIALASYFSVLLQAAFPRFRGQVSVWQSKTVLKGEIQTIGAGFGGAVLGGTFGCIAGTALGVSRIDPHDRFFPSLLGSLLGFGAGIWLTSASQGRSLAVPFRRPCYPINIDVRVGTQAP